MIAPDYAEAHYRKGQALVTVGKHQEAVKCFNEALRIRPSYNEVSKAKAEVIELQRQKESALTIQEGLSIFRYTQNDYSDIALLRLLQSGDVITFNERRTRRKDDTLRPLMFERAELKGLDLHGANLQGADLRISRLSNANLSGANLSGARLVDADLRNANLSNADLHDSNLQSANMKSAFIAC
jgi:uncharacterized protein YjbI with pentapeptide repeats